MSWTEALNLAYITALIGLVLWLIKSDTSAIRKRMDCFETNQHACQLENAKTFVTKGEFSELERTVINHDRRIITIETRETKQ